MPQRLPSVLSAVDLPEPELFAAWHDGEVYRVDSAFCPIDEIEQPRHRALALHAPFSERVIAEQQSAAWIWGAIDAPPARHRLCVATGARIGRAVPRWASLREVVIDDADIASVEGVQVTTPLRTIVDLARFSERFDAVEVSVVRRLLAIGGLTVAHCAEELRRRRNLPNKQRALSRLARC